jgi:hypothetical protein
MFVSDNRLDGHRAHLVCENLVPVLFATRQAARSFADEKFGYIRNRPDLRDEPHGWRIPRAVKVRVEASA